MRFGEPVDHLHLAEETAEYIKRVNDKTADRYLMHALWAGLVVRLVRALVSAILIVADRIHHSSDRKPGL